MLGVTDARNHECVELPERRQRGDYCQAISTLNIAVQRIVPRPCKRTDNSARLTRIAPTPSNKWTWWTVDLRSIRIPKANFRRNPTFAILPPRRH